MLMLSLVMSSVEELTWAWVDFCSNPWAVRQEVTTSDVVSVAVSQRQAALHAGRGDLQTG